MSTKKNYFALLCGAFAITMIGYKIAEDKKHSTVIIPRVDEYTESITYPVPVLVQEPTPVPVQQMDIVNIYNLVNEDVYGHLLKAQDSFNRLYVNGEVSSQMRNMGTSLTQGDVDAIDYYMRNLYTYIYQYVISYQQGDVNACYEAAKNLQANNALSREYLFSVLVSRKLPGECQSGISFNQYESLYDESGNIILNDGRRLRLIGGSDDLIRINSYTTDEYSGMVNLSEWYEKLPGILMSEYESLNNSKGYDGICYVWNQTNVENACYKEWEYIRGNAQTLYGISPNDLFIYWDSDISSYVYGDSYGRAHPLDYQTTIRLDHLYEVQDALASHQGDVYFLDNYIKNMKAYESNKLYTR